MRTVHCIEFEFRFVFCTEVCFQHYREYLDARWHSNMSAMEVRVFSVRNKIEDMKVVPIYLKTELMLADIGSKSLEPALFISLRDQLCG
jgi:hypothetical protein